MALATRLHTTDMPVLVLKEHRYAMWGFVAGLIFGMLIVSMAIPL
jgi:hypothetical protein